MKRIFLYLAVITVIALLVLVLAPEYDTPGRTALDTLLLPDVAGHINDVDRVEIVTAGNSVLASMVKGDAGWQLQQMGGYHADWAKLQSLLAAVAQARIVATKTNRPEYYARLGVEDVSQGERALFTDYTSNFRATGL